MSDYNNLYLECKEHAVDILFVLECSPDIEKLSLIRELVTGIVEKFGVNSSNARIALYGMWDFNVCIAGLVEAL